MADLPALVDCIPQRSRMTASACSRLWTSTQQKPPEPWESRYLCRHCPVGAERAGGTLNPAAAAIEALACVCPRCERTTDRLINDWLCVSCYNRAREVRCGADRKGKRPALSDRLRAVSITVADGKATGLVRLLSVLTRTEAIIVAARRAGRPVVIGVPPLVLVAAGGQGILPFPRPPMLDSSPLRRRRRYGWLYVTPPRPMSLPLQQAMAI